jgi:hypothetical protein
MLLIPGWMMRMMKPVLLLLLLLCLSPRVGGLWIERELQPDGGGGDLWAT